MKRSFVIVSLLSLSFVRLPSAIAGRTEAWAVVPVTRGNLPDSMEGLVSEIRQELERQGRSAWSAAAAVEEFERQSSRPSRALTRHELERWHRDSGAGIRHLTTGEHAAALAYLERAERLSRSARDELNREPVRAQRVLDTCLYMARALLETDDATGAAARASECLRRVPRSEPAGLMHPPEVLALYEREREAAVGEAGVLAVESNPSKCDVRINGVHFGQTPMRVHDLASGEYAVEVECAGRRSGRVHSAEITPGHRTVFVNAEFDRTVRTEPILRLQYAEQRERGWRAADARAIAESLPAVMLVLVSAPAGGSVAVELVTDQGTRRGCARIAVSPDGFHAESLAPAVRELIRGQCREATAPMRQASRLFNSGN